MVAAEEAALVLLVAVSIGATHAEASILALWPGILTAFLMFRLFDITKPWLAGQADRRGATPR